MDVHPPNPALDALLILIAELHRTGKLDDTELASIAHRLELSEHHDIAERVEMLPLMNMLADGGNTSD